MKKHFSIIVEWVEVEIFDFNKRRKSQATKRFRKKRPVHAGHHPQKPAGSSGYLGDHWNFRKNKAAIQIIY